MCEPYTMFDLEKLEKVGAATISGVTSTHAIFVSLVNCSEFAIPAHRSMGRMVQAAKDSGCLFAMREESDGNFLYKLGVTAYSAIIRKMAPRIRPEQADLVAKELYEQYFYEVCEDHGIRG